MLVAGAGLWLPALPAAAERTVALVPRAVHRPEPNRCRIDVSLAHAGDEPLAVLSEASAVGTLAIDDAVHSLPFRTEEAERRMMSRVVRRAEHRPVVLAADEVTPYASYVAWWPDEVPAGARGTVELRLSLALATSSAGVALAPLPPVRVQVVRPA